MIFRYDKGGLGRLVRENISLTNFFCKKTGTVIFFTGAKTKFG